ncbi:MAG: enoyl-CoA hydratase-related protein, partial [Deltaproteobacteria bacterium]|nr:enoyl-CoA hydratase-related protein [Deltaproteobacteria bacterium]
MAKVIYEKRDRLAFVTLNRPEALNALDDELNRELWEVWSDFNRDDAVDVAILTGAGKAFSAGADLKTFIPKWEQANMLDLRRNLATGIGGGLTRGQHRITKPIIAAVNGHAVGGGFELALACDIRIASEKAKFGVFEVRVGLHPGDGGLVRLVAIAGIATALDLALTGREVDAEEAYRLGLVHRVVSHENLLMAAEEYAQKILKNSQKAIRSAKETILDIIGRPL